MRLAVSRDSILAGEDEPMPCVGAVLRKYIFRDERTVGDPKDVPAFLGQDDWWFKDGKNHRVEKGRIVRDIPGRKQWFLDVPNLKAFVRLIRQTGAEVSNFYGNPRYLHLRLPREE